MAGLWALASNLILPVVETIGSCHSSLARKGNSLKLFHYGYGVYPHTGQRPGGRLMEDVALMIKKKKFALHSIIPRAVITSGGEIYIPSN